MPQVQPPADPGPDPGASGSPRCGLPYLCPRSSGVPRRRNFMTRRGSWSLVYAVAKDLYQGTHYGWDTLAELIQLYLKGPHPKKTMQRTKQRCKPPQRRGQSRGEPL